MDLDTNLSGILNEITSKAVGATCVTDSNGILQGIITDYDLRKQLSLGNLSNEIKAFQIMNKNPIRFSKDQKAYDVLLQMEDRKRPISVAPIVETVEGKLEGIISLHDLIQKGLK